MQLCCEQYSQLGKTDTLFIHGNLASSRWWRPTLQEWKRQGSLGDGRLLLADWRGCGQNEDWAADKAFSLQDLAEDYLELLDKRRAKNVSLVGHSLGGLIAMQMMVMTPSLFSRTVLLDPVGAKGVVFDDSMYEAFRQMAASPELTRTVILSTILNGEELERDVKDEFAEDAFKAVRGIGSSVLQILKTVDLSKQLAEVQTPTLILHGAKDAVIPMADSQALHRILPKSKLEILENQGHCFNIENPVAFTQRIRTFLQGEVI